MRRMLALGILVMAMLGVAGLPVCDSGCSVHAEEAPPALKKSDRLPFPPAQDDVSPWDQYQRLTRQSGPGYQTYLSKRMFEERRGPLVGDFWTKDEIKELFTPPSTFGR